MCTTRPIQLMIAGAHKSGTTSLLNYIGGHPDVYTNTRREFGYFILDSEYEKGYEFAFRNYFQGEPTSNQVVAAKSVSVMYSAKAIRRLSNHNRNVQVILSLRNPVDRAYSAYWFARRRGHENLKSFETALWADPERFAGDWARRGECAYLDRGRYIEHIRNLLLYFRRDQLHVFLLEDISRDAVKVTQEVFGLFDCVDKSYVPRVEIHYNPAAASRSSRLALITSSRQVMRTPKRILRWFLPPAAVDGVKMGIQRLNTIDLERPPMNKKTRARLIDYFKPYNDELSKFLGRDLNHWNSL